MLWGWAGETLDDELLTDITVLVKALPGELGTRLSELITEAEVRALEARGQALLENPVMPLPSSQRPIPWPAF